jgi:cell division protein FtsX
MGSVEWGSVASLISVAITLLLTLFGAFRFVTAMADTLRKEIDAAKENSRLIAEKGDEAEARHRHAMANQLQQLVGKMDADIRQLQRETVRQEQLNSLESRIGNSLGKIEAKVDKFSEMAAELHGVKAMLARLDRRLGDGQ